MTEVTTVSLTPAEIIRWRFRRSLFGYSVKEVKGFLQQVSEVVAHLLEENRSLKEERERLLERLQTYQAIEQQLQNALVVAEKAADEVRQQAKQEANLIIAQAEQEAERKRAEAQRQVEKALDEVERLRRLRAQLIAELRHLLLAYLEVLEKTAEQEAPTPASDAPLQQSEG